MAKSVACASTAQTAGREGQKLVADLDNRGTPPRDVADLVAQTRSRANAVGSVSTAPCIRPRPGTRGAWRRTRKVRLGLSEVMTAGWKPYSS